MRSAELEQVRTGLEFAASTPLSEKLLCIAIRAQNFTGSTGVAIALRQGGKMVCCANWGTSAPEEGAEIGIEHSFTGICVQTGDPVRCDDTQTDPRVDREACQALGVRAIVAAPLRRGPKVTLGVIAAFSDAPHAFTDKHVLILTTLAEAILELLEDTHPVQTVPHLVETTPEPERAGAVAQVQGTVSAERVPLTFAGREPAAPPAQADLAPIVPVQSMPPMAAASLASAPPASLSFSASAATPSTRTRGERGSAPLALEQPAAAPAAASTLTFGELKGDSSSRPRLLLAAVLGIFAVVAVTGWRERKTSMGTQVPAVSTPEPIQASTPQPEQVQGMVPAQLIQRVEPLYPETARRLNISGRVTVKATITNTGTVSNVFWVSGNQLFRDSAITAVKQWRYEPASLNGQPVESDVEIVLLFTLL